MAEPRDVADETRKAIHDWIREDVPLAGKMNLMPRHVDALIERIAALRSPGLDRDGERMRGAAYQAARKTADEMHARAKRMESDAALSDYASYVDSCANFVDVLAFGMLTLPLAHEEKAGC